MFLAVRNPNSTLLDSALVLTEDIWNIIIFKEQRRNITIHGKSKRLIEKHGTSPWY